MKKISVFALLACFMQPHQAQECITYTYGIPSVPWAESFGNHRAVLRIDQPAPAVRMDFEWRRPDQQVEKRRLLVIHAESGDTIPNILRQRVDNERCSITFGPVFRLGTYYFYYLPYQVQPGGGFYYRDYLAAEATPQPEWQKQVRVIADIPEAHVVKVESRTAFDSFFPMEVTATAQELKDYRARYGRDESCYLFAEDRKYPVKMRHHLPSRWMRYPQNTGFSGQAAPGEYYAFQVALWSPLRAVEGVRYQVSDLKNGMSQIPAQAITCFNLEGVNPAGKAFSRNVNVPAGQVQPLWFGVDIPMQAQPGTYRGTLTISEQTGHSFRLPLALTIEGNSLADRGDSEPWRHSRLRWLNSTIGLADTPTQPYTTVQMDKGCFQCLGRKIKLDSRSALPAQISVWSQPLLSNPIRFVVETDQGIKLLKGAFAMQEQSEGRVRGCWRAEDEDLSLTATTTFEFDGWMNYQYTLMPKHRIQVKDVRLELELPNDKVPYFLGAGLPGQETPEDYQGKWDAPDRTVDHAGVSIPTNKQQEWLWPFDSFWMGGAQAGVHCELRGSTYSGPLLNAYRPPYPASWHNGGKGGFHLKRGKKTTMMTVYSGDRTMEAGQPFSFDFALLITPVKPLDLQAQFTNRYYHNGSKPVPTDVDVEAGVKIINIHHANEYHPFINYPFLTVDKLKEFTKKWHQKGLKVKLYYTLRELSNVTTEIWALRSLGNEILRGGNGGGFPWLREHFVDGYTPQWYQHFDYQDETGIVADAAILTTESDSRWYNYYIEGLRWMIQNMDIDGIYMDDVSFGRDILQRMRRAMESVKPGCIIDLHSNTGFSRGPANQYAEFFPYIDKLWFGESFIYDRMTPANWLVESSGIPFGLTGDMLHRGGNKWLGMQYGMTVRHPWLTEGVVCDPRVVWKVWDSFGIAQAKMYGWWDRQPAVTASDNHVKVTAFVRDENVLLSVGNYSDSLRHVRLSIDHRRLRLKTKYHRLRAVDIPTFQSAAEWDADSLIPIEPRKGWLLQLVP